MVDFTHWKHCAEMFEIKYLIGALPPAIVDHQFLVVGVGTVFYWLFWGYYKGQSRKVWTRLDTIENRFY